MSLSGAGSIALRAGGAGGVEGDGSLLSARTHVVVVRLQRGLNDLRELSLVFDNKNTH
jgi:hypothetical protein